MFLLFQNCDGSYTLTPMDTGDTGTPWLALMFIALLFVSPLLMAPVAYAATFICACLGLVFGLFGRIRGFSGLRIFSVPFVNYGIICSLFATYSRTDGMDPVSILSAIGLPIILLLTTALIYYICLRDPISLSIAMTLEVMSCYAYMIRDEEPDGLNMMMRAAWLYAFLACVICTIIELSRKTEPTCYPQIPIKALGFNGFLCLAGFGILILLGILTWFFPSWLGAVLTMLVYAGAAAAVVLSLGKKKKKFKGSPGALLLPMLVCIFFFVLPYMELPLQKDPVYRLLYSLSSSGPILAMFTDFNIRLVWCFQDLMQRVAGFFVGMLGGSLGSFRIPGFVAFCMIFLLLWAVIAITTGILKEKDA